MQSRILIAALAAGSWLLPPGSCPAGEPYLAFLRGLQGRKYGEQALAYLDSIAANPDLPEEIKSALDLERSKCLRLAADEAYDPPQREARLAESKRLAEKFFKENPDHPAAGAAIFTEADEALITGQTKLAEWRILKEQEPKDKALADSRTALANAKVQFEGAVTKLKEKLDALPMPENPRQADPAREELEFAWLDARLKAGLAAYFLAQTITDEAAPERKTLLEMAGKAFDSIFQEYRSSGKPLVAMLPHMWHGKVLEDLGDKLTAMDVYDEVLVLTPDAKEADSKNADLAPLFGQAYLFRLRLIGKDEDTTPLDIVREGQLWLDAYKGWQATDPYQGIALEVAKAKMTAAGRARGPAEKNRIFREVAQSLLTLSRVESSYKHEIMALRREANEKSGTEGLTTDDRLSLVDDAMANKNWAEAEKICREVVEDATKKKDAKRLADAKLRLRQVLYNNAAAAYTAGDMEKVLKLSGEIAGAGTDDEAAEGAASLAVFAALNNFTSAKDAAAKDAAMARLEVVAKFTIDKWPDSPAGDDARTVLAQANLIKGDNAKAVEVLATVTPQSKRYATAMQLLGQIRWNQYFAAKKAPDAAEKADAIAKLREEAIGALKTSVDRQQAAITPGDPLPPSLFDTQLLLAQTHLEGQQWQEAAGLFAPLLAEIQRAKPTELTPKIQQAYVGASRSLLAAGSADQAGDAAVALAKLSPDTPQGNAILVDLAKLMAIEIRKVEAEQAADATALAAPGATSTSTAKLREAQGELLDSIVGRKALAIPQLIFVGDACVDLGKGQLARDIYARLLDSIDKDPEAKKTAGAAVTRIRSRQVGLLRNDGKLDDAFKQVEALLKAHPNALEPMLEKGYILEAIAERNPKRVDDCVAHWTELRLRLGKTKPVPPEYYEVLYNCARVLVRQARVTKDKEKALTAEKMLKSPLTLTPRLSGEDMVAKYNALLRLAILLQGRKPPMPTTSPEGGQNQPITATRSPGAAPGGAPVPSPATPAPPAGQPGTKTTPAAAPATKTGPPTTNTSAKKKN